MKRRRPSRDQHSPDEEPSHDRYLITYADLITLLLGLFVILYAGSQVDSAKYRELSSALSKAFKGTPAGDGVLPGGRGVATPLPVPRQPSPTVERITRDALEKLQPLLDQGSVEVEELEFGVKLRLSERLLFSAGRADLQPQALSALDTIAAILQHSTQEICVDGHTDSIHVRSFQFSSNWHLSSARALAVAGYLTQRGMPEANLVVRGFGASRPVKPNTDALRRILNRRVEIVITTPPEARADTALYLIRREVKAP